MEGGLRERSQSAGASETRRRGSSSKVLRYSSTYSQGSRASWKILFTNIRIKRRQHQQQDVERRRSRGRAVGSILSWLSPQSERRRPSLKGNTSLPVEVQARAFRRDCGTTAAGRARSQTVTQMYVDEALRFWGAGEHVLAEKALRSARRCGVLEYPRLCEVALADLDVALAAVISGENSVEVAQLCMDAIKRYERLGVSEEDDNVRMAFELFDGLHIKM